MEAGYKVGVVRQMETAALKAVGDNRNKQFKSEKMRAYGVCFIHACRMYACHFRGKLIHAPWTGELCEVYTKSTMLVEDVDVLGEHTHVTSSGGASVYMMCLCEEATTAQDSEAACDSETVRIGMVCIDTASGDIVYDEWEDGHLRQSLASRVAHLQPRELLLPQNLSDASSKLLKRLVAPLAQSQASAVR